MMTRDSPASLPDIVALSWQDKTVLWNDSTPPSGAPVTPSPLSQTCGTSSPFPHNNDIEEVALRCDRIAAAASGADRTFGCNCVVSATVGLGQVSRWIDVVGMDHLHDGEWSGRPKSTMNLL
jgi:hypothetical protein